MTELHFEHDVALKDLISLRIVTLEGLLVVGVAHLDGRTNPCNVVCSRAFYLGRNGTNFLTACLEGSHAMGTQKSGGLGGLGDSRFNHAHSTPPRQIWELEPVRA